MSKKKKPVIEPWLKEFLDEKVDRYNRPEFIENDPIQIPHRFTRKEDIEVSAFLTATIAWGNRKAILAGANKMLALMDNDPHAFITGYTPAELKKLQPYVYRTFNGGDFISFIKALRAIYKKHGGIEKCFTANGNAFNGIQNFREKFLKYFDAPRTNKHVSDPASNASCKRLNMFLRWMIRSDNRKVDFGIWNNFTPAQLMVPLDIHTGNTARHLGILQRNANDRKAVEELMNVLRILDANDPVKYDFALFGTGVDKAHTVISAVK